eukprot:CAMPEP_0197622308 /NCGR_PEP_ID=MMETSP1338-20131121/2671_1 /TAXON_ID=43686 ORGANISM="Pelagodinium beii, Strain RCC1491" /NCGR_SAMPLE_ID=MMETSP1338 /ASSEMBLY_ACC=CAM_ASM_000754 /LENGTH=249 /DNA_ID=CAMNT_0043192025 /DNA_START=29 /DNA_END=775 /DNA_ORIENTATION=+
MPYVLLERFRSIPLGLSIDSSTGHYAIDIIDILAGLMFIVGSVCFTPPFDHSLRVFLAGCMLYAVGGLIYFLMAAYSTWEMHKKLGTNSAEVLENYLYLIGSFVFFVGTILYWPDKADQVHYLLDMDKLKELSLGAYFGLMSPEFEGTLLFIAGSLMFAAAAFINGLNHNDLSSVEGKMLTATTSLYMGGSLLFVMGSVAFLPHLGCSEKMIEVGGVSYILGSVFYTVGAVVSLVRTHRRSKSPELKKL